LAFVVMTYAYLGAPRTTRQNRTMSLMGAISAVAALRGLGFVGMIAGVHTPIVLALPYLALIAAFVLGYIAISRGVIIEPPAFITNSVAWVRKRMPEPTSALMGQAPAAPGACRDVSDGASSGRCSPCSGGRGSGPP